MKEELIIGSKKRRRKEKDIGTIGSTGVREGRKPEEASLGKNSRRPGEENLPILKNKLYETMLRS